VYSVTDHPSATFWRLLARGGPAEPWPARFYGSWTDPRGNGREYSVNLSVLPMSANKMQAPEPLRVAELRCLRMVVDARDYRDCIYDLLAVPIPAYLFRILRDSGAADESDLPLMAWAAPDFCVPFVLSHLRSMRRGSPVFAYTTWPLGGGRPDMGVGKPDGYMPRRKEVQRAESAHRLSGQLVKNMTLRGQSGEGRDAARVRLLEAGGRLKRRYMKIGRKELADALGLSIEGVADLLARAEWKLPHLREMLNSAHKRAS